MKKDHLERKLSDIYLLIISYTAQDGFLCHKTSLYCFLDTTSILDICLLHSLPIFYTHRLCINLPRCNGFLSHKQIVKRKKQ